jgi:hypothetical protein
MFHKYQYCGRNSLTPGPPDPPRAGQAGRRVEATDGPPQEEVPVGDVPPHHPSAMIDHQPGDARRARKNFSPKKRREDGGQPPAADADVGPDRAGP